MKPIPETFTRTVVSREFSAVTNGVNTTIRLEIGEPINDVETVAENDWRVPVRVLVDDKQVYLKNACGIDCYQALLLAMTSLSPIAVHHVAKDFDEIWFLESKIDVQQLLATSQQIIAFDAFLSWDHTC